MTGTEDRIELRREAERAFAAAWGRMAQGEDEFAGPAKMLDGANRAALKLACEVEQLREALFRARRRIIAVNTALTTKDRGRVALDAVCEIDTALDAASESVCPSREKTRQ